MRTDVQDDILQVCDRFLASILQASGKALFKASSSVLDDAKTGQEFYEFWKSFAKTAQKKAESCTERYEAAAAQVISLEDEKNRCYIKGDALKCQQEQATAKLAALQDECRSIKAEIGQMHAEIMSLEDEIRRLEKDKEIYDILRWIPFVNLISELVAAIEGTREKLNAKIRTSISREQKLQYLYNEMEQIRKEAENIEWQILDNQMKAKQLEEQQSFCQLKRDEASSQMIAWKNRERYYLQLMDEMEHLIDIEADVEAFRRLIMDNPPPFQLTV